MEIVDPPGRGLRGPSVRWLTIVDTLKNKHPGEYGLVGQFSNGVATQIRKGIYPAFIPESVPRSEPLRSDYMTRHWDITTRKRDLYIKWVGDGCTCRFCNET